MVAAVKMSILIITLGMVIVSDLRKMIIPNQVLIVNAVFGFVFAFLLPSWSWILGAAFGGGLFLAMYLAMPGMLGEGDIKLVAIIGLYLGWPNIVPFIVISILACSVICLFLVLIRKATMQSKVPFAPFLGIGAVATVLFQTQIWSFIGYMVTGF